MFDLDSPTEREAGTGKIKEPAAVADLSQRNQATSNDAEGYYLPQIGEVINNRYKVRWKAVKAYGFCVGYCHRWERSLLLRCKSQRSPGRGCEGGGKNSAPN